MTYSKSKLQAEASSDSFILHLFLVLLVPDYYELNEVFKVLHGTGTDINLEVMLEASDKQRQDEKQRVLLSLLSGKHFTQARKFADLVGLVDDDITLKEVK